MDEKKCVAMLLAGGRGKRLGGLAHYYSKPAIHFGNGRRLIDFTLDNCRGSGIRAIGVLSQYFTTNLHEYIECVHNGRAEYDDVYILPSSNHRDAYKGTADAVYKNLAFMERFKPDNVIILPCSHIYRMDYKKMLAFHEKTGASVTVAATSAATKTVSRFGRLNAEEDGRVLDFAGKPSAPEACLASMGIYIFTADALKKYLTADNKTAQSQHDLDKNIIPQMLSCGEPVFTYRFDGYWRDVAAVDSLWEANMDQIDNPVAYGLRNDEWGLTDLFACDTPIKICDDAVIRNSIVSEGCVVRGRLERSVLSDSVTVGAGSEVINSVIMPNVYIGNNVKIYNAVIGSNAQIMDGAVIGTKYGIRFFIDRHICPKGVSLVAPWLHINENSRFPEGSHICSERLAQYESFEREIENLKNLDHSYHGISAAALSLV